jgi:hypothetical protein
MHKREKTPNFKKFLSREMHLSRRKIHIGTKEPVPITPKQAGIFLVQDVVEKLQYLQDVFECNGFALALAGAAKVYFAREYQINPAFGIVWTRKTATEKAHAFNFYVTPRYQVICIEPQSDLCACLDQKK